MRKILLIIFAIALLSSPAFGINITTGTPPVTNAETQNAVITSSTIDSTVIGGSTPAAGSFTDVTASGSIVTGIGATADGSDQLEVFVEDGATPDTGIQVTNENTSCDPCYGIIGTVSGSGPDENTMYYGWATGGAVLNYSFFGDRGIARFDDGIEMGDNGTSTASKFSVTPKSTRPSCAASDFWFNVCDSDDNKCYKCINGVETEMDTGAGTSIWTRNGTTYEMDNPTDDVVIGDTTIINSAKVTINEDADQVGLAIQGDAGQTASFVEYEKSDGTIEYKVGIDGAVTGLSFTSDATSGHYIEVNNATGDLPACDTEGRLTVDTTVNKLYICDGANWETVHEYTP